ncbi:MAG: SEFIR domain-containing protein [Lentimonas sp.]
MVTDNPRPRTFLSYSWSSPEHEEWVVELANELTDAGIHVTFDKWDLREGNDSIAFMEKMVNDPEIKKVILVCDRVYSEKANRRVGGVGTESQIISPEIYRTQDQNKFVAVIAERDEHGKPFLPTYYTSRIFIDLSDSEHRADGFEKLVRWLYDKPLHVRPTPGSPPSYILESSAPSLGTSAQAKRALDGIRTDKAYARGAVVDYFESFRNQLERFRVSQEDRDENYDWVVKSAEDFRPYRNQAFEVIGALAQYGTVNGYAKLLHRFLESLLPYCFRPPNVNSWSETDFDNFKIVVHELFLGTVAILLNSDAIEAVWELVSQRFYIAQKALEGKPTSCTYLEFNFDLRSLQIRNQRANTRWLSPHGEFLKSRFLNSPIDYQSVIQADFVLFLRADLTKADQWSRWWPVTLVYLERHTGALELFTRSASRQHLARTLKLVGVSNVAELRSRFEKYASDPHALPRWDFRSFSPAVLVGIDELGTSE